MYTHYSRVKDLASSDELPSKIRLMMIILYFLPSMHGCLHIILGLKILASSDELPSKIRLMMIILYFLPSMHGCIHIILGLKI